MSTIPNPDSWMDVATILLVALIAAVPSWLALRSHKAVQSQAESVKSIEAQVINGHGDKPMRADLDRVIVSLEALGEDVRGLRLDLAEEEQSRRGHVSELRSDLSAARAEIDHLRRKWTT